MADAPATVPDATVGRASSSGRRRLLVVGAVSAVAFLTLTVLVAGDATQGIDDQAAAAVSDPERAQLIRPTKAALRLLDPRVSIALAIVVGAAAFARTSRSRHLVRAVVLVVLWGAITVALKVVLDRPLPHHGDGAYPSGHTGGAIVVCIVAALVVVEVVPAGPWRRVAVVVLATVPLVLGALLVATGGHWLTDVVGGALLAVACAAAIEAVVDHLDASGPDGPRVAMGAIPDRPSSDA